MEVAVLLSNKKLFCNFIGSYEDFSDVGRIQAIVKL
jgi:hypothetical protein